MNNKSRFFVPALILTILFVAGGTGFAQSAANQYTSLIVDAREIDLDRSMSPKILSENNYEIYGTIFKDVDKLFDIGVVMYAQNLDMARKYDNARVGNNPLLVKALKADGPAAENIILADNDARLILEENKNGKFLEKYRVIVLIRDTPSKGE